MSKAKAKTTPKAKAPAKKAATPAAKPTIKEAIATVFELLEKEVQKPDYAELERLVLQAKKPLADFLLLKDRIDTANKSKA